jgi:putative transcriptional regulator
MTSSQSRAALVLTGAGPCQEATPASAEFAFLLKGLRRRLLGKQTTLAYAVGCTEAAVSYWENGKRAPDWKKLCAIAEALREAGATLAELHALRHQWERVRITRIFDGTGGRMGK